MINNREKFYENMKGTVDPLLVSSESQHYNDKQSHTHERAHTHTHSNLPTDTGGNRENMVLISSTLKPHKHDVDPAQARTLAQTDTHQIRWLFILI